MEFRRHVCRTLHEDHLATLALLERLGALLGRHAPGQPPDPQKPEAARLLKELIRGLDAEIRPHFAFEEESLFPLLAEAGDSEMGGYLAEEHALILPLAERVVALARQGLASGFSAEAWAAFHESAAALIEHLDSHARKEEGGLLPALDDLLDEETDGTLAVDFAARR